MILRPPAPSANQPQVEVESTDGHITFSFWMQPRRFYVPLAWLTCELDKLPNRYSWRGIATQGSPGIHVEVSTYENRGRKHKCYFRMTIDKRNCTRDAFNRAFQQFYAEVLEVARGR